MTPEPYYADDLVTLYAGDCVDVMRTLPDCSVDAVITDPPYGLGFMGKAWDAEFISGTISRRRQYDGDPSPKAGVNGGYRSAAAEAGRYDQSAAANRAYGAWCEQWAAECLRVLKPGGHLLAFGGTRTYHRIACAVEDVGFEVRDSISWLYGSGFPKSLDVSKAIDRHLGAERPVVGRAVGAGNGSVVGLGQSPSMASEYDATKAATAAAAAAAAAEGWGTALKPAHEPIVVGRKSLVGTVAANVLAHGTGALNIDACRIAGDEDGSRNRPPSRLGSTATYAQDEWTATAIVERQDTTGLGRWPTNAVLDDSQAAALDEQTGLRPAGGKVTGKQTSRTGDTGIYGAYGAVENNPYDDTGGASRFFPTFRYEAKAGSDERPSVDGILHPTVKPLDLMRWLVRLVTPPGGTVLEPFAGSGTTAEACVIEGFRCIAIEREADYLPLIVARLSKPIQPDIFGASA